MSVDLIHLPYDIPVIPLHLMGYAASPNESTALQESILPRCEREICTFRGNLVPQPMRASDGLHATGRVARAKANRSGKPEWGYLFRLTLHVMVASPSPAIAAKLAGEDGTEIWDALRPFAEADNFQGVKLPTGLVVFHAAQDGIYLHEEFVWRIKSYGDPLAD